MRPLRDEDIEYKTVSVKCFYQAFVHVVCCGEAFAGELARSRNAAERSAVMLALEGLGVITPVTSEKGSRKGVQYMPHGALLRSLPMTPKVALNTLYTRVVNRFLLTGETSYTTKHVESGVQASVQLYSLPGNWGSMLWTGQVCRTKRDAEQSAAKKALNDLVADEAMFGFLPDRVKCERHLWVTEPSSRTRQDAPSSLTEFQ